VALPRDGVDVESELGRDHDLVAYRGKGLADELLVDERPVELGSVEEGDALVDREADQVKAALPVNGPAIGGAQAHASKP
jgi:hypothetical protein